MGHWLLIVNKKDRKHIYGFKKRIKSKEGFMNLRLLKKYFKMGIILSVLSLTACQFSPTSTTVTITNDTNEEIVYWLSYRLGEMQDIKDRAPTLAPGESKTWKIKGTLSATAEKEVGLYVNVLSSEDFDELKYYVDTLANILEKSYKKLKRKVGITKFKELTETNERLEKKINKFNYIWNFHISFIYVAQS